MSAAVDAVGGTATDIAVAVRSGAVRARDVLEQCIARIGAVDASINAFTVLTLERARAEADAIDARRAAGEVLPPLAGVPFAVKNLFDVRGVTTISGSKVLRDEPAAAHDAVLVERMGAAGAVLVGALNMDEFAYGFTTENHHAGPCRNPHDPSRIAGGSSGGSAAAVAAGMVPLTLGSDTNGSIRVPSSLCGTFGLKPTFGRLSRRGSFPFVASLDHLGPFARSAADLAAAYDAMQGPDPLDPACAQRPAEPALAALELGLQGLRVGVLGGHFERFAGPQARDAVRRVADALGAVERVELPLAAEGRAAAFVITASEGGALHRPMLARRYEDFEPMSRDRFIAGSLVPAAWYVNAQRVRAVYRARAAELFSCFDILVAPATPVPAWPIGTQWVELDGQRLPASASMGILTQPISCIGLPVVAAPVAIPGALPIGVQLIAAPWREADALRVAHFLQGRGVCAAPVAQP